jgi:hypothetical protein
LRRALRRNVGEAARHRKSHAEKMKKMIVGSGAKIYFRKTVYIGKTRAIL